MKKKLRFLGYIAIAAIITLTLASCEIMKPINEPSNTPADTPSGPSGTYTGTINDTTYTLTVYPATAKAAHAAGDNFTLTVKRSGSEKTSSGKLVGVNGNTFSAQPSYKDAAVFTIIVSGSSITDISTDGITFNDGSTEQGPGSFSSGGIPSNVDVTGVTLDPTTLNLTVGGSTGTLTATVAPSNATNKTVSWSTSDDSVATVNNGVVTAVAVGSATITVTTVEGGKTATCAVTVNPFAVGQTTSESILFEYYWVNEHGSLVTTSGNAVTIAAGATLIITAQSPGYTVKQWHLNGINTEQRGDTYSFSSTTPGKHTVSLFVEKDGKLYNTNIAITVLGIRSVTIDMYDYYGDGWDDGGALRINVNGVDIAPNIRVESGFTNTYTFNVATGYVVQLYWVAGSNQNENSFIAYYTGTPPSPAFTTRNEGPTTWSGSNALVYRLRNTMNDISDGTLLGSFTVQ